MNWKIEEAKMLLASAKDEYQRRLLQIDRKLATVAAQNPKAIPEALELQASYSEGFTVSPLEGYEQPPASEEPELAKVSVQMDGRTLAETMLPYIPKIQPADKPVPDAPTSETSQVATDDYASSKGYRE